MRQEAPEFGLRSVLAGSCRGKIGGGNIQPGLWTMEYGLWTLEEARLDLVCSSLANACQMLEIRMGLRLLGR